LAEELSRALDRLVEAERQITTGVEELSRDVQEAALSLALSDPADAAVARGAEAKLESDAVGRMAAEISAAMDRNVLFANVPRQEAVAESLEEVARILSGRSELEQIEAYERALEEFIRRQAQLNRNIETAAKGASVPSAGAALGKIQSDLRQAVLEQATALALLAEEIMSFKSRTAVKLEAAGAEMNSGAADLYRSDLQGGLEHGIKALALLKEAREAFPAEQAQMCAACRACQSLEAALLLQRILARQRSVNEGTLEADNMRLENPDVFARKVGGLATRQSEVRVDARRLEELLAQFPAAAALTAIAGEKMDGSRVALEAADTGSDTRILQRQIIAMLEELLCKQKGCLACMGMSGKRVLAMMQMMQSPGPTGGGYTGGTNAPIFPTALDEVEDEEWRKTRSHFEGALLSGFEAQYPAEFRDLLTAYFASLRKEMMQ
jgi:hypothetical protein